MSDPTPQGPAPPSDPGPVSAVEEGSAAAPDSAAAQETAAQEIAAAATGGAGRGSVRLVAESTLIGLVVGLAVVAPWTHGGYLLLLDWVSGPNQAASPKLYGLDPTALDAMPYRIATQLLRELVGARVTGWLMVLLYFPIAAGGVSALAGGGRWRRHPAALFVVCNPFVVERVRAGHVGVLLCIALLTWLLSSALKARRRDKPFAARPAGWYALAMTISPHAAWLGGACLLAVALCPRPRRSDLVRTGVIVLTACGVYLYAVVVALAGIHTMRVTGADLDAYATRAGPGGLLPTVLSLHGFWRESDGLPRDITGPWAGSWLLAVLVTAVAAGLVLLCQRDPDLGSPLAVLTLVGLALGAGVNGPLGSVYRAALDTVPLFGAMREQQKWLALAMIGYAVAVGAAAEALAHVVRGRGRVAPRLAAATGVLALGWVCVAVAPSLVWGLGGSVAVTRYPQSWYAADKIMGAGTGAVLFLPWHAYQAFTFTQERTVATPAPAFFQRPVLSSDAVELGPLTTNSVSRRQSYVQRLIADGGAGHLGQLLAPLGVEYVLLARDHDRDAAAYRWLERQTDLRPVLRVADLELYRVEPVATGRVVAARPAGYSDAVTLASRGELGTEALVPDGTEDGTLPSTASGGIRRRSSTSWHVEAGPPGWVVLPEEWSPGWRTRQEQSRPTAAGTVAIRVGPEATSIEYVPWRLLRLGILASVIFLGGLFVAGLREHRRELVTWWARRRGRVPRSVTPR